MTLFDYADTYPNVPGHRWRETSIAAAESMKDKAPTLRARCLAELSNGPSTADQIAGSLEQSILSVRPRVAELARMGLIVDTGVRALNASGKSAIVWAAA
jgi:predicted Rossmann fold nucleotide-binding protein DprA/Smf involved in DNA uptake